jgi:NAD(P)-dependent dehydrogenase (short-subunit alcohol dehydrogenase family)
MKVLITGANRGIGLGLAELYLQRDDTVVATARDLQAATQLQALEKRFSGKLRLQALDVCDAASCTALATACKDHLFDVMINNAGLGSPTQHLSELDFALGESILRTNALGPLRLAKGMGKLLKRPGGKLVNISSRMGSIGENAMGGAYFYRMSKAALNMASKNIAVEWHAAGIIVLALHPGWVQTRMGGHDAPVTVEQSAAGLVKTIDAATLQRSGGFFNYDGTPIVW